MRFTKGEPSLRLSVDDCQQAELNNSLSRLTNSRALRNAHAQHLGMCESGLYRANSFWALPAYDNCDPRPHFWSTLSYYETLRALSYLASINGRAEPTFRGKDDGIVWPGGIR